MLQEKLSKKTPTIALVGGGTGGHIFPLVAIAEELHNQGIKFIYIGGARSLEQRIIKGSNWPFEAITVGKWRRYLTIQSLYLNIVDFFRTVIGVFQAYRILQKHRVRVVFSKGGFVALPVVIAAKLRRVRVFVHESDAVMGLSNKLTAKLASKVLTAFDAKSYSNYKSNFLQVGIPIRNSLRRASTLKAPKKNRQLILVLPGSQGSLAINSLLKPIIPNLLKSYDVIHLTGEKDYESFDQLHQSLPQNRLQHYRPYKFIDRELPYYFQTADIIVSRSSATTIAEAALFKKASYLIPLPSAASDHQLVNAQRLVEANAAVMRQENQLNSEILEKDLVNLLRDTDRLKLLGENLNKYFVAEGTIAKIMEVING